MSEAKICRHCKKPVVENSDNYEVFENMHWLCFHLVFEHEADPDVPCNDPSCPWWHIDIFRNKLLELNVDPDQVIEVAIKKR